ncbi:tRNA pseudouridine(38-40) synthase TruA [Fastidiosibacter lacustris]|uniref:tRNA pseudouridine(38-40) synthase TruA n=1 Tax=Fastidiosibacter lacustris TaxID=2056695 RepID=UPI000E34D4BA|nr:tRNA pseudouridine(38-40) synthase TruA [Fastidiosibacter lacustris]
MLQHYALVLEYCGTKYSGWQRQIHSKSVQEVLENALSQIANQKIQVVCAGRTDAGVHATAQVVHFSTTAVRKLQAWVLGTNAHLPNDIKISCAYQVDVNFSARFSALYRRYQYVIYQHKTSSALWYERSTWFNQNLDILGMNEACQYLLGEQDFSVFRSSQCQSLSTNRNIHHAYFTQKNAFIIFDIQGNAFLHHMVRNIVGSMLEVGLSKRTPQWIQTLIAKKDRTLAGQTAPAQGLYLIEVGYPEHLGIKAYQYVPFIHH